MSTIDINITYFRKNHQLGTNMLAQAEYNQKGNRLQLLLLLVYILPTNVAVELECG